MMNKKLEILKIWFQWMGIGLAAIPSGIILGILLLSNVKQLEAQCISLAIGLILATVFWNLIGNYFTTLERKQ